MGSASACELNHIRRQKELRFSLHWHEILSQDRHGNAPCSSRSRAFAFVCGNPVPQASDVFDVLCGRTPHDGGNRENPRSFSHGIRTFDALRLPGTSRHGCFDFDCADTARIRRNIARGQCAHRFRLDRGVSGRGRLHSARPEVVEILPVCPLHLPYLNLPEQPHFLSVYC